MAEDVRGEDMSNNKFIESRMSVDMSEVSRCILCHDPECSRACPQNALEWFLIEENLGEASCCGKLQIVLKDAPAQPASNALLHMSYVLATIDDESRNGFSSLTPQMSVERSIPSMT